MENLDSMTAEQLMEFYLKYANAKWMDTHSLFPGGQDTDGSVCQQLAQYACNKAFAMTYRKAGNIEIARGYEATCDKIFKLLPEWARW